MQGKIKNKNKNIEATKQASKQARQNKAWRESLLINTPQCMPKRSLLMMDGLMDNTTHEGQHKDNRLWQTLTHVVMDRIGKLVGLPGHRLFTHLIIISLIN